MIEKKEETEKKTVYRSRNKRAVLEKCYKKWCKTILNNKLSYKQILQVKRQAKKLERKRTYH